MTLAASEWSDCSLCITCRATCLISFFLYFFIIAEQIATKACDCVAILAVINELFSFASVQKCRLPDKEKAVKNPFYQYI